MKHLKYILSSILFCAVLFGDASTGGVQFFTHYDKKPMTSLTIPSDSYINIKNDFIIEFDFRIREKSPFGYIMSLSTQDFDDIFVLSYIEFHNADTSYIELFFPDNPTSISLPFPNSMIGRGYWHSLHLGYKNKVITLILNDSINVSKELDLDQLEPFQLHFGKVYAQVEPPRMDMKNLRIWNHEKLIHHWPLNEFNGYKIYDHVGNLDGKILNGEFLSNRHKGVQWVQSVGQKIDRYSNYFIDRDDLMLFYLNQDSLYQYDIQSWELLSVAPSDTIPYDYRIIYDDTQNRLFLYHNGGDLPFYDYNWTIGKWDGLDVALKSQGQYFDIERIYIPKTNAIYSFGGYGWYTYKNDIYTYSIHQAKWAIINPNLKENKVFTPRIASDSYYNANDGQIYIFGGTGSKSGKQEAGIQHYSDIWAYNIKTDSLLLIRPNDDIDRVDLAMSVSYQETSNTVFELVRTDLDSTYSYHLNIFDFPDGEKRAFPLNFDDFLDLSSIHDIQMDLIDKTSELIFIAKGPLLGDNDQNRIHFFTLALPLINPIDTMEDKPNYLLFGFILTILVMGGLGFYLRKKEKIIPQQKEDVLENIGLDVLDKGVTVQLFGVFRMWIDGKEILKKDWKSKKARELFIYLILKNHQGVTGEDISLTFWQDVASDSAVNSRSVALARIRKVLGKYGHHLVRVEDRYLIQHDDTFYSDSHRFQTWMKENNDSNFENILEIIGPIGLLSEFHDDWVENIKTDVNRRIINHFKKQVSRLENDQNWGDLTLIGESILSWNPLDDEALVIYVNALKQNGKQGLAHQVYDEFIRNYEMEIKESYNLKYEDI